MKGYVQLLSSITILLELVVRLELEGVRAALFLLKQPTDIDRGHKKFSLTQVPSPPMA